MLPEQQYEYLKTRYYPNILSNIKMVKFDSGVFWSWKYNNCWECHFGSIDQFNTHNIEYAEIQQNTIVKLFSEFYLEKLSKGCVICYYPFYESLNNLLIRSLTAIKFYRLVESYKMFDGEYLSAVLFSNNHYKNIFTQSKHAHYGKQFLTEWRNFNGKF